MTPTCFFTGLGEIPVGLLAFHLTQLSRKIQHHPLCLGMLTDRLTHLPGQLQHGSPGLPHQLVPAFRLLLVEMEQFHLIGERGLDLPDTIFGQVRLPQLC